MADELIWTFDLFGAVLEARATLLLQGKAGLLSQVRETLLLQVRAAPLFRERVTIQELTIVELLFQAILEKILHITMQ